MMGENIEVRWAGEGESYQDFILTVVYFFAGKDTLVMPYSLT